MARQTTSPLKSGSAKITESLSTMNGLNGKLMACYASAGQTAFMNAVKMNQEIMRFASERFQADVQAMARCTNWNEMADYQTDFARTVTQAYEAEMSKLMAMGSEATSETLKPLQEAAETAVETQAQAAE